MQSPFFIAAALTFLSLAACKRPESKPAAQQEVKDSLDYFGQLLARDSLLDSVYYARGLYHIRRNQNDRGIEDLKKAVMLSPEEERYASSLSDAYLLNIESRKAIEVIDSLLLRKPDRLNTLLKKARLQLIVQDYGSALAVIDRILEGDPENSQAYYLAGHVFYEQGDTGRAVKSYQKAADLDPEFTEAWNQLGDVMTQLRNPLAIQYYDNALRKDPDNIETLHNKAFALQKTGRREEAMALYRANIDKRPDFELSYYNLGILQLESGQADDALLNFDRAITLNDKEPSNYYYRAKAHIAKGSKDMAAKDLRTAIGLHPGYDKATQLLKSLGK